MIGGPGGWLYRLGPSLVAGGLFLAIALLWNFDRTLYLMVMHHYIWTLAGRMPFDDLEAVLLAGSCWRQGVDVYVLNGCMHGGSFNYSPLLLRISLLGLGPGNVLAGGVILSLMFIAASALLPPARTRSELLVRCAILCSSAAAHGVEAGNIDLAMFSLVMAGVALQRGNFAGRMAGQAIFVLGGALKFYPAVLLALLLREDRRRLVCIGTVLVLGAAAVLWHHAQQLMVILNSLPLGLPFRGSFGAINLPFGLTMLAFMTKPSVLPTASVFHAALLHPLLPAYVVSGKLFFVLAGLISGLQLAPRYAPGLAVLNEEQRLFLVAGAVLMAFCFCTAPNYEYRGTFLLLAVPGLCAMARAAGAGSGPWVMVVLMPLVLWERQWWEVCRRIGDMLPGHILATTLGIALWVLREYVWWFIMVRFIAIAIAFLRAELRSLLSSADQLRGPGVRGG